MFSHSAGGLVILLTVSFDAQKLFSLIFCAVLSCSVVSNSLWPHGLYSPRGSSVHGDAPGKNTGVGYHALLQGLFPTQESNPALPHCRLIIYQLSHQGSPRILEWVAYPFSSGSSQPRNQTGISCIAVDSLLAELPGKTLVWYSLTYSCSSCLCRWCHIQKTTVKTNVEVFSPMFSSRSFTVSSIMFKSLMHFKLFFVSNIQ